MVGIKLEMDFLYVHLMVEIFWMFLKITPLMSGPTGPQLDTTTVMDGRLRNSVKACFSWMRGLQKTCNVAVKENHFNC